MKKPFSRFLSCILGLFFLLSFSPQVEAQVTYLQGKDAVTKLLVAIDTETNNLKNGVYTSVNEQSEVLQQLAFYKQVADAILASKVPVSTDAVVSSTEPNFWYELSSQGYNGPVALRSQPSDDNNNSLDRLRIETRTLLVN